MPQFTVQHSYYASTSGKQYGPWSKGDVVDLDVVDARWVNRDSKGTLKPVKDDADTPARPNRQQAPTNRRGA